MNTEECNLYLKVNKNELLEKNILVEYWNLNKNGYYYPIFVKFVIPEEIEQEEFNNKILQKSINHNIAREIKFSMQKSFSRTSIKSNTIEKVKTIYCSQTFHYKNEGVACYDRINYFKRYISKYKASITFKYDDSIKKIVCFANENTSL